MKLSTKTNYYYCTIDITQNIPIPQVSEDLSETAPMQKPQLDAISKAKSSKGGPTGKEQLNSRRISQRQNLLSRRASAWWSR